jgi:O-antigen ligase
VFLTIGSYFFELISFDIVFLFDVIVRRMEDLFKAGLDPQGSMSIHIMTRLLALDAFALNPLFGVGLGVNASPWFSETYNAGWAGSHSHHLDILGQTGIVGALLEWLFMGTVVQYMWRGLKLKQAPRHERLVLAGIFSTIIFIILANILYHFFLNDFVWYLLATGTALSRAMLLNQNKRTVPYAKY